MSTNAPESLSQRPRDVKRHQVYLDALTLSSGAPDTVCVVLGHYQTGRHPVPYRIGYAHHYRQEAEHWHNNESQLHQCRAVEQGQ